MFRLSHGPCNVDFVVKVSEFVEFPTVARLNPHLLKITKMFERVQIPGQDFLCPQLGQLQRRCRFVQARKTHFFHSLRQHFLDLKKGWKLKRGETPNSRTIKSCFKSLPSQFGHFCRGDEIER